MSDIKKVCNDLRRDVLSLAQQVKRQHKHQCFDQGAEASLKGPEATGEMHANLTLAYRHLEDARMRLGKVIQAFDGGESCYS